ncbi:hypothetical protein HanRHA438_Chr08g0357671 [Helianthus annuus]|nr:hypothetical protein HanRHA438_Chr08g0357671 [Helianthus annuus]
MNRNPLNLLRQTTEKERLRVLQVRSAPPLYSKGNFGCAAFSYTYRGLFSLT